MSGGCSLVAVYELLIAVASLVTEHQLRMQASVVTVHGLTCPKHVESSRTRDRTHIPCIGRWILNHWTARVVHDTCFLMWMCLQSHNFLSKYLCSLSFFSRAPFFIICICEFLTKLQSCGGVPQFIYLVCSRSNRASVQSVMYNTPHHNEQCIVCLVSCHQE